MIDQFVGSYFFLSNFYIHPIMYKGHTYDSTEHAFQAQKNPERWEEFMGIKPGAAKRLGDQLHMDCTKEEWDAKKVGIMEDVLRIKFSDPGLRTLLRNTKNEELIEGNTWGDDFWGVPKGRSGKNMLGKLLMKIRQEIQDEFDYDQAVSRFEERG